MVCGSHSAGEGTFRRAQLKVFGVTFCVYAAFHLVRRSLSVIKPDLLRQNWLGSDHVAATHALAAADTVFLALYAVGLFFSGFLGDRVHRPLAVFVCSYATAVTAFLFAGLGLARVHASWPYVLVWGMSGLVQSGGWPLCLAIVSSWFAPSERGTVIGAWAANAPVGNIAGALLVSGILAAFSHSALGWQAAMVASGLPLLLTGALVLTSVHESPLAAGYGDPSRGPEATLAASARDADDHAPREGDPSSQFAPTKQREEDRQAASLLAPTEADAPAAAPHPAARAPRRHRAAISFWAAWRLPGVAVYAAAYGIVKMVAYALMNWLPLLIAKRYGVSGAVAGGLSSLVDVGTVVGGVAGGALSDSLLGARRALACVILLAASVCGLLVMGPADYAVLPAAATFVGVALGGPGTLINGAAAADIGANPAVRGSPRALSTVVGIIDGVGSVGAALGQGVVGALAATPNAWTDVMLFLVGACVAAIVLLLPMAVRDVQHLRKRAAAGDKPARGADSLEI